MSDDTKLVTVRQVKRCNCLRLTREAMNRGGVLAQTAAVMRNLANDLTGLVFASTATIAERACLRRNTVKEHIRRMLALGWLEPYGHCGRRTCTYRLSPWLLDRSGSRRFALLPIWAARMLTRWSERAVYAAICSRQRLRREYSATEIAAHTGLSVRQVKRAKARLIQLCLIIVERGDGAVDALHVNMEYEIPTDLLVSPKSASDKSVPQPVTREGRSVVTKTCQPGDESVPHMGCQGRAANGDEWSTSRRHRNGPAEPTRNLNNKGLKKTTRGASATALEKPADAPRKRAEEAATNGKSEAPPSAELVAERQRDFERALAPYLAAAGA